VKIKPLHSFFVIATGNGGFHPPRQ
jgi:hypothetical protein